MIRAVGVGPGDPELLTLKAARLVEAADLVAGFETVLEVVAHLVRGRAVTLTYANQEQALAEVAAAHRAGGRCVVCFMGDPSFSGWELLERVERAVGHPVEVMPGISSAQMVAARGRVAFDEAVFVSFHRRGDLDRHRARLLAALGRGWPAIVLPRPWDFMPDAIASWLVERGVPADTPVTACERLTLDETLWAGTLGELRGRPFGDLTALLIRPAEARPA